MELIRLLLRNTLRHKLRSLLTMLGMIFGVGAVVAMLSITEGAQKEMMSFIDQLGVNNIIIEAREALDRMVDAQALMIATNNVYLVVGVLLAALAVLIWLMPKPTSRGLTSEPDRVSVSTKLSRSPRVTASPYCPGRAILMRYGTWRRCSHSLTASRSAGSRSRIETTFWPAAPTS